MSKLFWLSLCLLPEEMDLKVVICACNTTHFYFWVKLWVTGLWTWLLLPTQQFFIILSWPVRVLGFSACVEGKARFWLGLFFVETYFLAGNKFSNSDYKVASGNAGKLLTCRSSLKNCTFYTSFFLSGQQRKFLLSFYLCNVLYNCHILDCWLELNPLFPISQTSGARVWPQVFLFLLLSNRKVSS